MKPTQKLAVATFLCLSIFTFLINAIRITGSARIRHGHIDPVWGWFWEYIESCVATIIASMSAFSPLYFDNRDRLNKAEEKKAKSEVRWENVGREGFPAAPLATLTRIHRFLYDDARLIEGTETIESTSDSVNVESRPHVLSASREEPGGKEKVHSPIAPASLGGVLNGRVFTV